MYGLLHLLLYLSIAYFKDYLYRVSFNNRLNVPPLKLQTVRAYEFYVHD